MYFNAGGPLLCIAVLKCTTRLQPGGLTIWRTFVRKHFLWFSLDLHPDIHTHTHTPEITVVSSDSHIAMFLFSHSHRRKKKDNHENFNRYLAEWSIICHCDPSLTPPASNSHYCSPNSRSNCHHDFLKC